MTIQINDNEVIIDGVIYTRREIVSGPQLAQQLKKYHGAKEYDETVSEMITWYYGKMQKVAWCAIAVSYICKELGFLTSIGGKNANVNQMREACFESSKLGYGKYYGSNEIPMKIKKNDILFWLWKGDTMTDSSSKHVGIAEYDSSDNTIYCLGGNQSDKVCTAAYNKKLLYAVYRIGG